MITDGRCFRNLTVCPEFYNLTFLSQFLLSKCLMWLILIDRERLKTTWKYAHHRLGWSQSTPPGPSQLMRDRFVSLTGR